MKPNTIVVGDVRHVLDRFADASVDCIVTSPPYVGLRDYGHPDQLGAEQSVDDWVKNLRLVAQELHRVLTPTGSLWLNVGDSYSAHPREGAARKSLLLGPQRLALALADDNWLVRNVVVWAKPNPMPSSVTDRLSTTYETVLLLVRSPRTTSTSMRSAWHPSTNACGHTARRRLAIRRSLPSRSAAGSIAIWGSTP